MTAVRKNRYVILPVDFEEAWKVCVCLASSITFVFTTTQLHPFLQPQQTVKRSDDTHEFCKYFDSSWILVSDIFLKIHRPVAGLDLVRPLFA